jgi:hypothetical protein
MTRLSFKAVGVGVLVDVAALLLTFMLLANQVLAGRDVDAVLVGEHFDILGFVSLCIGVGMVTVGAFAAGMFAGRDFVLHGGAVGVANLLFFAVAEPFGLNDDIPLWYLLMSPVAVVPAGLLGGYLAQLRDRRARV